MQYMLMIYGEEGSGPAPETAEFGEIMQGYGAFTEEVRAKDKMVAGDPLQPVSTATTVRVRDGAIHTTDGPFAETKESIGGYDIIEVADLDEAIAWAGRCPVHPHGLVEVRPVMELPEAFESPAGS